MLMEQSLFLVFLVLLICPLHLCDWSNDFRLNPKSPLYQELPNCDQNNFPRPKKQTKLKGILCPMVKDEIGFLSEWVAYYEMQGNLNFLINSRFFIIYSFCSNDQDSIKLSFLIIIQRQPLMN
jgi:hypothetical protein